MRTTILVESSDIRDSQGRSLVMIYTHIHPGDEKKESWIKSFDRQEPVFVTEGDLLGTIVRSRNPKSTTAQHLHQTVSLMFASDIRQTWGNGRYSDKDEWPELDRLVAEGKMVYYDPLELFEPETVDMRFVQIPTRLLETILLFHPVQPGEPDPDWSSLRQPVQVRFPGMSMPGAKSLERAQKVLAEANPPVDLVLANGSAAADEIRRLYGDRYPIVVYPGTIDKENGVLRTLERINAAGFIHDQPISVLGENAALFEKHSVFTVGDLMEAVSSSEKMDLLNLSFEEGWAFLRAGARVAPELIPVEVFLPPETAAIFRDLGDYAIQMPYTDHVRNLADFWAFYGTPDNAEKIVWALGSDGFQAVTQARENLKPPVQAGLEEELKVEQKMGVVAEAMPGGQALAVQASVFGGRPGLKEFLSRLPQQAGLERIVLEGDEPADWGAALVGLTAERVVFLGERSVGELLRRILPEMEITVFSPGAGLEEVLLGLGISSDLLGQINAAGVEQELASYSSA